MRNEAVVAVQAGTFEIPSFRKFAERYMAKGRAAVHAYEAALGELHEAEGKDPANTEEAIKLENWKKAQEKNMLYGSFFSVSDVL